MVLPAALYLPLKARELLRYRRTQMVESWAIHLSSSGNLSSWDSTVLLHYVIEENRQRGWFSTVFQHRFWEWLVVGMWETNAEKEVVLCFIWLCFVFFKIMQSIRDWLKTNHRTVIRRLTDARSFTCSLSIRHSPVSQNNDAQHISSSKQHSQQLEKEVCKTTQTT